MPVNDEVRQNNGQFQYVFFGIGDLRSVDNCLEITLSDIIITDITFTLEALAWIIMSVKIKSVKFMSVNDKVRKILVNFSADFSGASVILDWSIIVSKWLHMT